MLPPPLPDSLADSLLDPGRRFSVREAKELTDLIYDGYTINDRSRFHARFFYEICPATSVAAFLGSHVKELTFTGGNQEQFDAIFLLETGLVPQKVEICAAIDGHNNALQRELLDKQGHAPGIQKIEATGTKKNRRFGENKLRAVAVSETTAEALRLIDGAISKKRDGAKRNPNYPGAWLVVVFDDMFLPERYREKRFSDVLNKLIDETTIDPFSRCFCVGVSRKVYLDSVD